MYGIPAGMNQKGCYENKGIIGLEMLMEWGTDKRLGSIEGSDNLGLQRWSSVLLRGLKNEQFESQIKFVNIV